MKEKSEHIKSRDKMIAQMRQNFKDTHVADMTLVSYWKENMELKVHHLRELKRMLDNAGFTEQEILEILKGVGPTFIFGVPIPFNVPQKREEHSAYR